MRSVSASHARVCAKVVEHRLDELREVVIVLPAPVLPCVGVVEVHRPTVGWKETEVRHSIQFLKKKNKTNGFPF